MPPEIDFCPVELPGRAARLGEPPITAMSALVERLSCALQPLMGVAFAFFGHSVGAAVAFEAARQLRSADGRTAVHLFVSAHGSPGRTSADPAAVPVRSDQDLLAILGRYGATPTEIMQCPELMSALLPALRADLALVEGYSVDPGERVVCPITAFGGTDDLAHSGALRSWANFTSGEFRTRIFPGGHFYLSPLAEALAQEIIQDLRAFAGTCAAGMGSQI